MNYYPPFELVETRPRRTPWINIILFVATIFTTMAAGALHAGADILSSPLLIYKGIPFSASLMLILGVHEAGHYLASRRWGVKASLPYFIPMPHPLLGTMGAFIKVRSPIPNRKALVDIGASGPLSGFVLAVLVTAIGLASSKLVPAPIEGRPEGRLLLGSSLIFSWLVQLVLGHIPEGYDIILSPMAFAGWIGLFVTALNLIPVGQLDGGHVTYALFGERHRFIARLTVLVLLPMGMLWMGWLLWAFLLVLFLGMRHPPPYDPYTPLDRGRKLIGYLSLSIFVLCFTPTPFKVT
ncbi:MAG TPA: site-2 protease family protein [Candidatus Latescibacteria bacterium]|nr:site-2 protease family protein [Candidatus Latescibacterota bacterium]